MMARDLINIRNKDVCRAIRELAALKGQTLTDAVDEAVSRKLEEVRRAREEGASPPR